MFFLLLLFLALAVLMIPGYFSQEPNEARVMVFFGKYKGTFTETGFFWVNPFMNKKKLSLRARNLDVEPIKVNDKIGNPILIGLVLVWKLKDTYKAMFEIDAQTMADNRGSGQMTVTVAGRMNAFEDFVRVQGDAALRQVAGLYAYDDNEADLDELTLRSGGDEINEQLEQKLNERLAMAGMEIVEARINYLAYAPEIAAVMLRRQQASAIISAREKIVEGAVSMVRMALHKLSEEERDKIKNQMIGFVFQFHYLLPEFTALENVMLPALLNNFDKKLEMEKRAKELLEKVGLGERENHKPSQLSGGEKQRVAIARALINSPKILLADEPTGNLDEETSEMIFKILKDINKNEKQTIIVVTHSKDLAEISDKQLYLKKGVLVEE